MSQQASHQLLGEIVRCPEVVKAESDADHPCAKIVESQEHYPGDFQPPTPWVGKLSQTRILFIGSNPSIGGKEHYPTTDWSDRDLIDFFDDAFEGNHPQIKAGIYAPRADGSYSKGVRPWAGVRARAKELLEETRSQGATMR